MLSQSRYEDNFFYEQNICLRKKIRDIDREYQENICGRSRYSRKDNDKINVNFLVIGPDNSSKSTLLKNMSYSLNASYPPTPQTIQTPFGLIKKFPIKESQTYNVSGLTKFNQTFPNQSITGYEVQQNQQTYKQKQQKFTSEQTLNKYVRKYEGILKLVDQKVVDCCRVGNYKRNCLKMINQLIVGNETILSDFGLQNVRVVLIVFSLVETVEAEEFNCIKFLVSDLKEKGLKYIIVLTHTDQFINMNEFDRLSKVEEKINFLKRELQIENRDDFVCVENSFVESQMLSGAKEINERENMKRKVEIDKVFSYPITNVYKQHFDSASQTSEIINPQKNNAHKPEKIHLNKAIFSSFKHNEKTSFNNKSSATFSTRSTKNVTSSNQTSQKNLKGINSRLNFSQNYEPKQQICYYMLKLLLRVIKQNEKIAKEEGGSKRLISWFCG